jgi:hypothetical protein
MSNRTLLDISEEMLQLEELLEDVGGDLSDPDVGYWLESWLEAILDDVENKLDNTIAYVKECELLAEAHKAEIDRHRMKVRGLEGRAKWLKERMVDFLVLHGMTDTIETRRFTLKVATAGGHPPVEINEGVRPEMVTPQFQRVSYDFDKTAIREYLEHAELDWAKIGERSKYLRIR